MIIRIVNMYFEPSKVQEFLVFLENYKSQIRSFPGCIKVDFLQNKNNESHISTYSQWESEEDLNKYRDSELFKLVWANTKIHFNQKPQANTYISLDKL